MNATLMLGLALGLGAPALKDKPEPAAELYGLWQVESPQDARPDDRNAPLRYQFNKDGTWQVFEGTKEVCGKRGFCIDPKARPPAIDFNTPPAPMHSPLVLGIFKIEGDRLTLCDAGPGKDRPTEFRIGPGQGTCLMYFRRVNPTD